MSLFRDLLQDDDGAVTVDWVVLTAAVVIMTIGAIAVLDASIQAMLVATGNYISFSNILSFF
jgi:Flp pilus assembly pilin Flp